MSTQDRNLTRPRRAGAASRPAGVIGLGNLGLPYAQRLIGAGFPVVGFDLRAERLAALAEAGGRAALDAAEVGHAADPVILSLPTAAAFAAVTAELAGSLDAGRVVVDTSTLTVADKLAARELLAARGATLIDAAVSTTPQALLEGRLVLFASGDERAFASVRPALEAFAGEIHFVGEFGNAARLKLVCNLLVAIHNAAAAEAMALLEATGLDPLLAHRVIAGGVASSRVWERRGAMMLAGDYQDGSFAYRIATHDAPMIDALCREAGAFTPLFQLATQLHRAGVAIGLERYDTASLVELYRSLRAAPGGPPEPADPSATRGGT